MQLLLEAGRLHPVDLRLVGGRVERAVEGERPHVGRELARVHRAEQRAVRLAEVGQLGVAHRLADPVHVASRVARRDEGKDAPAVLRACAVELLDAGRQRGPLGVVAGCEVELEQRVHRGIVLAFHALALADAARVEADDVEPAAERSTDVGAGLPGELDAGRARPTRVDQERADPVSGVGGRQADESERDRARHLAGIVERHRQRAALEAVAAVGPVDPADRGRRGRRDRGGRCGRCDRRPFRPVVGTRRAAARDERDERDRGRQSAAPVHVSAVGWSVSRPDRRPARLLPAPPAAARSPRPSGRRSPRPRRRR